MKTLVPPVLPARWVEGLLLVALIGLTLLLFAESFSADFTFDDFKMVVENPQIHNWEFRSDPWWGWHQHVRAFTYMIDYSLFGDSPIGWHVHNLFWHILSLILFYFVVKGLTNRVSISFVAALLFATHPIHVDVVTNITNRKELLGLTFMLASGISYGRFIQTEGRLRTAWLAIAILLWIVSLFSRQFTIVLPLYLVAYEFLFVPKEKRFLLQRPQLLGGGIILGLTFVVIYSFVRAISLEDLSDSRSFSGYLGEPTLYSVALTSARALWRYVGLLIWPDGLCPDHLVTLSQSFLEPITLLSWVGLVALVWFAFFLARRSHLLAFGLLCFLISYLPISNLLPTAYILADRYMYISSVGFCIVVVCLGQTLYHKLHDFKPAYAMPVMAFLGCLLVAGYVLKAITYNTYWKNERVLWQYALECNPQSFRAYNNLGYQYLRAGAYPEAIELLSQAINLGYKDAYEHRGSSFIGMENYEAALQDFEHAIAYRPDWNEAYYGRGLVYLKRKQYEKAIADFSRAIELNPVYSHAYNNRGLAYENLNRREEALVDYLKATQLDPGNAAAHNNLGRTLAYVGRLQEAIRSYKRAEQLGMTQATKILELLRQEELKRSRKDLDPMGHPKN